MIVAHVDNKGTRRPVDFNGIFQDKTAFLVGGSPSLKEQDLDLITQPGVITCAMNNAGVHFKPTMWISGDNINCYEPRILHDPSIMKFAPMTHMDDKHEDENLVYWQLSNLFFYYVEPNVPWEDYLKPRSSVPWHNNTLFASIHILYMLGIRTIILLGSDFGMGADGTVYAHDVEFGDLETNWNKTLYNGQAREMRLLKPLFDKHDLKVVDCSVYSRIKQVYPHMTLEEGVELCLEDFPKTMKDPKTYPHCSKYASQDIIDRVEAGAGIYQPIDPFDDAPDSGMETIV